MEKLAVQGIIKQLRKLFSPQRWQRLWAKDWVLKGISLLLATLLWYYVGGEEKVDKIVMMPIEIINLPRDLVISNQFKKEIEVTVSGPRTRIEEMIERDITRQINLAEAMPGTNVIENDNGAINVPSGVTVLRIQPSSIILSLDKLIQKQFPVIPLTAGDAPSGYILKNLVMDPDTITITGPQTILGQVDELRTKVIDITGMTVTRQLQVPLDLAPSFVELIGQTSVTAEVIIQPQMQMKKLVDVPIDISAEEAAGKQLFPKSVEVVANIPVLLIKEKKDIKSLFSVTALPVEGSDQLRVEVIPDSNQEYPIEILSVTPEMVDLVAGDVEGGPAGQGSEEPAKQAVPAVSSTIQQETMISVQPVVERAEASSTIGLPQKKVNGGAQIPVIHPEHKKIKK